MAAGSLAADAGSGAAVLAYPLTGRSGKRAAGIQGQLKNATILKAQQQHIASPLFSLEDVLITPRVIAPPPALSPGGVPVILDIAEQAVPYMLDWPELRVAFARLPWTLAEILPGDTHLAVLAPLGGGKTVALAHLATQGTRPQLASCFIQTLPVLVNAVDILACLSEKPQTVMETLAFAVSRDFAGVKAARLAPFLQTILELRGAPCCCLTVWMSCRTRLENDCSNSLLRSSRPTRSFAALPRPLPVISLGCPSWVLFRWLWRPGAGRSALNCLNAGGAPGKKQHRPQPSQPIRSNHSCWVRGFSMTRPLSLLLSSH